MYSACLPYSTLPHSTRIFTDYLARTGAATNFYPHSAHVLDWISDEAKRVRHDAERRRRVAAVLEKQNRSWGASAPTLENIGRLADGALAVVTGQQVALFGGPLFSIYKALSAIKIATEASRAGVPCVPVFWLATEDHDLAEVNHVALPIGAEIRAIEISSSGKPNAPVSSIALGPEIEAAVKAATEAAGEGEIAAILRECYKPGETLGSAFAKLFSRLFAHSGVILLDAADPALHQIAAPVYTAALEHAEWLDEALLARGRELESAGYHAQVHVTPSSTLLFGMRDGSRVPIHRENSKLDVAGEKLDKAELKRRIEAHPEQFSANVLLRPVVQDYLLPTVAYIGGPAEVAYFAQAAVVYEKLLGRVTPIVPRFAATLLEPKIQRLLARYELAVPEVFANADHLPELLGSRTLPPDVSSRFEAAKAELQRCMGAVEESLEKLDRTLVDAARNAQSKMEYQLESLRGRAARAELRRSDEISRHAAELLTAIYPDKNLQEREVGAAYFLGRYGTQLLLRLYDAIQPDCLEHQVIPL